MKKNKIDDFLTGRLNKEEEAEFERSIQSDPQLAKEVEEHRELMTFVDAIGDLQLKERIRTIQSEVNQKKAKSKTKTFIPRFWIAAAAIGLLLISIWFLTANEKNALQLFKENYTPYALNLGNRSDQPNLKLIEANKAYKDKNYESAKSLIENILKDDVKNSGLSLALGICYLEMNQDKQALDIFQELIQNEDPLYLSQAYWYKALIHLRQNDQKSAVQELQILANMDGDYYQKKAQKILAELK